MRGKRKQCFLPILLVLLVLTSGFVSGCSPSKDYLIPTQAESLSLDYQKDFMRNKGLASIHSWDAMEPLRQGDFKAEINRLMSARWVWLQPLRTSSVPYDEIEQHVDVWKTEEFAKESFRRLEPASNQLIQMPRIGDETKAWKTIDETFVVVFRKKAIVETLKVKFNMTGALEEPFFSKYLMPVCLEVVGEAADVIPD